MQTSLGERDMKCVKSIFLVLLILIFFSFKTTFGGSICQEAFDNRDRYDDIKMISLYTQCLAEGLGCDTQRSTVYNNRGMRYYNLKQYDNALSDLNTALKLNPKYAKAYARRAMIYRALGENGKAQADDMKAKKLQ